MTPTIDSDRAAKIKRAQEIVAAHRFVFLGGLHRSGTTLLFRMLRDHPQISGFRNNPDANEWLGAEDEGQYLQSVYPQAIYWGGPGKFAFDPEAHLTEQSELLTVESKAKLATQWFPHWDLSKPVLLEKSPPNLLWTRFLQSAFPASSFVMIVRHPVAVSLATEKWSPTGLESLIRHWIVAHETYDVDREHLKRVMTIKHENLAEHPADTMREICDFLGLEPHESSFKPTTEHNEKYFAQWRDLGSNPESRESVRECISRHEARVRKFGYSLEDLSLK